MPKPASPSARKKEDDRLLALHEDPPAWRHQNLAELHAGCAAEFALVAFHRTGFPYHRRLGKLWRAPTPGLRERLPGRQAERFRMGPAVVLGQDLAEAAGSVRDCATADLAAGNRKMGYGHRETAGTGLAHHLHDARPERLTLRAPRGSAALLDRAGPESRRCRAGQFSADRIDLDALPAACAGIVAAGQP